MDAAPSSRRERRVDRHGGDGRGCTPGRFGLGTARGLAERLGAGAIARVSRRVRAVPAFAQYQQRPGRPSRARPRLGDQGFEGIRRRSAWVDWLKRPAARRLSNNERTRLREEISELLLLQSRAEITLAERTRSEPARRAALEAAVHRLGLAERIDPHPPVALFADRARDLAALGEADLASLDRSRAEKLTPTSARDLYLLGTSLLTSHEYVRAEEMLNRAVTADAKRFWAWFALGLCHHDQRRYLDAAGDFGVCTALAPEFAWPYLNRGLSLATAGRLWAAKDCYDQALKVSPKFLEAHVNRRWSGSSWATPWARSPTWILPFRTGEAPIRAFARRARRRSGGSIGATKRCGSFRRR